MLILILSWFSWTWPVDTGRWYRNRCFLVALSHLILRRPNLEVATKKFLYHQEKYQDSFMPCSAWKCVPELFPVVWIFLWSGCYLLQQISSHWGSKIYFKDWCFTNSQPTFLFQYLSISLSVYLTQWIMAIQEYSQALLYLQYPELKTQSWIQSWNSILSREKKSTLKPEEPV